ncbi:sensor histidine kinase [Thalassobaculum sp.]|uniref:sensor histidine kinase n=1 Tax=Thalassobaculum sp. TaxID=2022740 RepID=UPI003B5CE0E8
MNDRELAESIIDAVREPLVVLDGDLTIRRANDSFYRTFKVESQETVGRRIYDLGNGQWDIPSLRQLLDDVLSTSRTFDDYLVEHDFPELGPRTMLLNARRIERMEWILLAIEDVTESRHALSALQEREDRLRLALEAGRMGAWEWDLRTDRSIWDARQYEIYGLEPDDDRVLRPTAALEFVHPNDRARTREKIDEVFKTDRDYQHEFRIVRPDGAVRWLVGHGMIIRDPSGRATRMVGINYDITEQKETARRQKLLTDELNHRVKNMLTTMQSIAAQTVRRAASLEDFQNSFSDRLHALARGHDILVRSNWQPTELSELLHFALEPFGETARIRVDCDDILLRPEAALAFCLITHELAINATKYGALSSADGVLDIECRTVPEQPDAITFTWRERGGPPVSAPSGKGFGSKLIERSARHDLNGNAEIDFRPEGVVCIIRFAPDDLAAIDHEGHRHD